MQIGIDGFSLHPLGLDPFALLEWTSSHDFAGIQFGEIDDLTGGASVVPDMDTDHGRLQEIRAHADNLGLYTHVSVGACNPFAFHLPSHDLIPRLSTRIRTASAHGWRELHGHLGGPRERYELPASWNDQMDASACVLTAISPLLRDLGCRINLEPHGDVTTFELLRLIDRVGADTVGICLDTANVLLHGEHPVEAARRAAPFTHLTHCKDAILSFIANGLRRQTVPAGSGLIDWSALIGIWNDAQPDLKLSIEDHKWLFDAEIFEERWMRLQPDVGRDELLRLMKLAWACHERIASGEWPDPETSEAIPYAEQMEERLSSAQRHLRLLVAQ